VIGMPVIQPATAHNPTVKLPLIANAAAPTKGAAATVMRL